MPHAEAEIGFQGLAGDAHDHDKHNTPLQAVSLLDVEDIRDLCAEGFNVIPGATGENLTLVGLDVDQLRVGDQLHFSGGVVVELTKQRKPCYVLDSISPSLKRVTSGRLGYYARVIVPGRLRCGETIEVVAAAVEQP